MMLRVPRGAGAGCRQRQRLAEAESGGVVSELVLVVLLEHSRHKGHLHCPCFRLFDRLGVISTPYRRPPASFFLHHY